MEIIGPGSISADQEQAAIARSGDHLPEQINRLRICALHVVHHQDQWTVRPGEALDERLEDKPGPQARFRPFRGQPGLRPEDDRQPGEHVNKCLPAARARGQNLRAPGCDIDTLFEQDLGQQGIEGLCQRRTGARCLARSETPAC